MNNKPTFLARFPIPISGLMLSIASIGNLLVRHGQIYKQICGAISLLIMFGIVLKLFFYSSSVKEEFKNPIILSVFATFSMTIMILATYINPLSNNIGMLLWFFGLLLHSILILVFTIRFILNFNFKKVFTTYFIVYVGIVVASVTAPAFSNQLIGKYIFVFGLISYSLLLPIILYRIMVVKSIPAPAQPTFTILAAPASLCLAGYLSSYKSINLTLFYVLLTLSLFFAAVSIVRLGKLIKGGFYPSFSAFTFPFAITAIAIKKASVFAAKKMIGLSFLNPAAIFFEIFAVVIILFVTFMYIKTLFFSNLSTVKN